MDRVSYIQFTYLFSPKEALFNLVYLSLGSTNITTNNTKVLITDIGEDGPDGLPTLTCHTDLTACCRNRDTKSQGGLGEWYYPDRSVVLNNADAEAAHEGFYRVRNAAQVVRLARRIAGATPALEPTGSYCCVIPSTKGKMTLCAVVIGEYLLHAVVTILLAKHILQSCVHPSLL